MSTYSRVRSFGAIALGVLCAAGTAYVLFWHVKSLSDVTTNHILIALALVCALGAGHYFWQALRQWQVFASIGFGILFLAGTGVCAIISAGRGAETLLDRQAQVRHADGARLNHERMVLEAKADRDAAKTAADTAEVDSKAKAVVAADACKAGKLCRLNNLTAGNADTKAKDMFKRYEQADARYWQLVAQLDQHKPILPANVELRNAAKIWSLLTGTDETRSNEGLELLWPFLLSFLTELGTIVFLNYGFGHERKVPVFQLPNLPAPLPVFDVQPVNVGVSSVSDAEGIPTQPPATYFRAKKQRPTDVQLVLSALERTPRAVSNDELAVLLGCSKSESSKRVSNCGDAVVVRRNGRYLAISPNYQMV